MRYASVGDQLYDASYTRHSVGEITTDDLWLAWLTSYLFKKKKKNEETVFLDRVVSVPDSWDFASSLSKSSIMRDTVIKVETLSNTVYFSARPYQLT